MDVLFGGRGDEDEDEDEDEEEGEEEGEQEDEEEGQEGEQEQEGESGAEGLQWLVLRCLSACPVDARRAVAGHVVVVGVKGST